MSLPELSSFLTSSEGLKFEGESQREIYRWVGKQLMAYRHLKRGKKERGILRAYLEKMTGLSVAQMTRLIRQYRDCGDIGRRVSRRHRFASK